MHPLSASTQDLLRERYGSLDRLPPLRPTPVFDTLLAHRSVRAFSNQPVDDETVNTLIAAAQSASTSSNLQVWSVIAIRDPERKARLSQLAKNQAHVANCPVLLVWLADLARLDSLGAEQNMPVEGTEFLEFFLMGSVDAALAAQNAAIAAESLGLGLTYIGGMRDNPADVAAELGLPPKVFAVFGMTLGYPDPARPASIKPRLPLQTVLHHEQYNASQLREQVDHYNAVMDTFYQKEGMSPRGNWERHSLKRASGPAALTGRDVLKSVLRKLGFALR